MMNRLGAIIVKVICLISTWLACQTVTAFEPGIGVPDTVPISWSSREYVAKLPSPHGNVVLRIEADDTGQSRRITIQTEIHCSSIDGTMIDELIDLSEPEIAIPVGKGGVESDRFRISFEFGVPYKIDVAHCKKTGLSCTDWVRDIVRFEVDSTGRVDRQILDVGSKLGSKSRD